MTAWQRSHITRRSEKGIGPISFRRLLIAGAGGGLVALLGGRVLGFGTGCLSAFVVAVLTLALSHPVEGLPLLLSLLRALRGLAATSLVRGRGGLLSHLALLMQVTSEEGLLSTDTGVETSWQEVVDDDAPGTDWVYLGSFRDVRGAGLAPCENPFAARAAGAASDG